MPEDEKSTGKKSVDLKGVLNTISENKETIGTIIGIAGTLLSRKKARSKSKSADSDTSSILDGISDLLDESDSSSKKTSKTKSGLDIISGLGKILGGKSDKK